MKIKFLIYWGLFSLSFVSCSNDDDQTNSGIDDQLQKAIQAASNNGLEDFILPNSTDFIKIPQDPKNPLTQEKVDLGKLLFHETGLAVDPMNPEGASSFSCSTCHFASAGFQANRHQGISDGGVGFGDNGAMREPSPDYDFSQLDVQAIRTPTAMNGAYQINQLWNGQFGATGLNVGTESEWTPGTPKETNVLGYEGLEIQAIAGLKVHRMENIEDFVIDYYKDEFDAAFPNIPLSERYSREYAGLAIAAFERTVLSNQAPFQRWLNGDQSAMTEEEKKGAILFFGQAKCVTCHTGPALNSMEFHALGMDDLHTTFEATYGASVQSTENLGRGGFTKKEQDYYKFKVPQLYNLADSPFYGHGASFRTIREVVDYKNQAERANFFVPQSQISDEFVPLNLTESELMDLTSFLTHSLRDPNLMRYQPDAVNSGYCFPANDEMSKIDLGCN